MISVKTLGSKTLGVSVSLNDTVAALQLLVECLEG
jgi:hypothetical protein